MRANALTSILSISILPYCLRISVFAVFIASRVAIVFRKLSVVIEADSILKDCCCSCETWPSYLDAGAQSDRDARVGNLNSHSLLFQHANRASLYCILLAYQRWPDTVTGLGHTFPGPFFIFAICSRYLASSASNFLTFTSIVEILESVYGGRSNQVWLRARSHPLRPTEAMASDNDIFGFACVVPNILFIVSVALRVARCRKVGS